MAPAAAGAGPVKALRVVTLNLFHGGASSGLTGDESHLETRLDMVARGLAATAPDIVGLQEASITRARGNVAHRLAERLGMQVVHAPATSRVLPLGWLGRVVVAVMNFSEGPAILSRFPIARSRVFDLPRCERRLDPRVLLHAEVQSPWGALQVFSTHTGRDDCQLRAVAEHVRAHPGPLPSILTGDLNAGEQLPGMAALVNGAGFVDAFRAANPGLPGPTVWQRIRAPESTVFRRVDYVLLLPGTRVPGRVIDSRVVLDRPGRLDDGSTLWPSDHYGVMADIDLGGPTASVE